MNVKELEELFKEEKPKNEHLTAGWFTIDTKLDYWQRDLFTSNREDAYSVRTLRQPSRQTGRTTRMVLEAIHALSRNPQERIVICAANRNMVIAIQTKMNNLLAALGMASFINNITYITNEQERNRIPDDRLRFYDHTCEEFPNG